MSPKISAAIFETALGYSALIWSPNGVVGCVLPERDRNAAEAQLHRRHPEAAHPSASARAAALIEDVVAMLAGEPRTVRWSDLDLSNSAPLNQKVYALAVRVPYGATTTYGDLARELGDLALAQAVGQALGANPIPILVPCHRVLGADGKIGGFSGGAGVETKVRLLNIEKARRATASPLLFDHLPIKVGPKRRTKDDPRPN